MKKKTTSQKCFGKMLSAERDVNAKMSNQPSNIMTDPKRHLENISEIYQN